jgi:hypothetical protein
MVTFVGQNSGSANATTATIAWPAGLQAGDVAVLGWTHQSTHTATDPGGFISRGNAATGAGAGEVRLLTRDCDGSESGLITLGSQSAGVGDKITGCLAVYRSATYDTSNSRTETAAGTTHANASVTTGAADCVIVAIIGERSSTGTSAYTQPSGYTKESEGAQASTGMTITTLADDGLAAGRSSGSTVTPGVWTSANSFSTQGVATWTVSLRPLAPSKNPQTISQYGTYF